MISIIGTFFYICLVVLLGYIAFTAEGIVKWIALFFFFWLGLGGIINGVSAAGIGV